ncbi:hypothetical protein [Spirulina sp. 06S082]|uniref:hypothetical protein n=1 Tax=Spirulina sp. 06S082 TaxID=3110248 RepID=UPI002B20DA87|nr:hypothetical protein [Spirulina sp. 06S082]MEA5470964.1 hypothetical protein [Spirulina sp. 06S082]
MTNLPADRATTLKEAFRKCDVVPLEGENIDKYYVDLSEVRKTEAIDEMNGILEFLDEGEFTTVLFVGHRGSGKSTELKRLEREWRQYYRVIYLEINEETDINDVSYTDLYLIVIKQIEFELRGLGLRFDNNLLTSFEDWFKEITRESEETVERSVSVSGEASLGANAPFLAKLLVKLLAQIRANSKDKKVIRQTLEQDISRLKTDINNLLADGTKKLRNKFAEEGKYQKGFLLIFDNMDRMPPEVGNSLFFDYEAQIQELHCTLVYTVPISVLRSGNVSNSFGSPTVMPMVNIYRFEQDRNDLEYDDKGLNAVEQLIEKRVDIDAVFESREQLRELAKISGGHVRQLMQMMRRSCLIANTRKHAKIMAEDVEYVAKQEQFNFERFTPDEHYPILAKVCRDKDLDKDEIYQKMLFNVSILEYQGETRWNYPNPLVKRIEKFKKAMANLQAGGGS